jgi:hypothetical protein
MANYARNGNNTLYASTKKAMTDLSGIVEEAQKSRMGLLFLAAFLPGVNAKRNQAGAEQSDRRRLSDTYGIRGFRVARAKITSRNE